MCENSLDKSSRDLEVIKSMKFHLYTRKQDATEELFEFFDALFCLFEKDLEKIKKEFEKKYRK